MKKIQAMMLMLLVVVMGMSVQSCTKEETTIGGVGVTVTWGRENPAYTIKYLGKYYAEYLTEAGMSQLSESERAVLNAFAIAVSEADKEIDNSYNLTDSQVLNIYNTKVAPFKSGKGFEGYLLITKNSSELGRITFTK